MQIKIHSSYRRIVALCDSDLIGKVFSEGIKQIELKENFFKGEEKPRKEVIPILKDLAKEDATFNIVGRESVRAALEAGVINEKGILRIGNIPVALVLL